MNVLVTGASSGIGDGLCAALRSKSFYTVGIARNICANCDDFLQLDLSEQIGLCSRLEAKFVDVKFDFVVLNHGTLPANSKIAEIPTTELIKYLELNFYSHFEIVKWAMSNGCRNIIYISSGAASSNYSSWFLYSAAKSLGELLISQLCKENEEMRCLAIRPGIVGTKMNKTLKGLNKKLFPDFQKFDEIEPEDPKNIGLRISNIIANHWEKLAKSEMIDLRHIDL